MRVIILSALGIAVITLLATLTASNHKLAREKEELAYKLATSQANLEAQNLALNRVRLDTESYKRELEKARKQTKTRYLEVATTDPACHAQAEAIEKALQTFYKRRERE